MLRRLQRLSFDKACLVVVLVSAVVAGAVGGLLAHLTSPPAERGTL